eukprot:g1408.t1
MAKYERQISIASLLWSTVSHSKAIPCLQVVELVSDFELGKWEYVRSRPESDANTASTVSLLLNIATADRDVKEDSNTLASACAEICEEFPQRKDIPTGTAAAKNIGGSAQTEQQCSSSWIELCGGRCGDLARWQRAQLASVVAVDRDIQAVHEGKRRVSALDRSVGIRTAVEVLQGDVGAPVALDTLLQGRTFDVVGGGALRMYKTN